MNEVQTFLRQAWAEAESIRIAKEAAAENARIVKEVEDLQRTITSILPVTRKLSFGKDFQIFEILLRKIASVFPVPGIYSLEVENAIQEANNLINQARHQLNNGAHNASKVALTLAQSASEKAAFARQRADQEDKAKARQARRNDTSLLLAGTFALIGAFCGAIVIGFAGCVSCVKNYTPNNMITDFNLFSGAGYGAIGGALIGAIIGVLIGQSEK